MNFSNIVNNAQNGANRMHQFSFDLNETEDLEELEVKVTTNTRNLGHTAAIGPGASPFSGFIVFEDDESEEEEQEELSDTEEEFPEE